MRDSKQPHSRTRDSKSHSRESSIESNPTSTVSAKIQQIAAFDPNKETYRQFTSRMNTEIRDVLIVDAKRQSKKHEKRKQFFEKKKQQKADQQTKKRRSNANEKFDDADADADADADLDEKQLEKLERDYFTDHVKYGEVALEPPKLEGVAKNFKKKLELGPNSKPKTNLDKLLANTQISSTLLPSEMDAEQRQKFEEQRQQAIMLYRENKKLRMQRNAFDRHSNQRAVTAKSLVNISYLK